MCCGTGRRNSVTFHNVLHVAANIVSTLFARCIARPPVCPKQVAGPTPTAVWRRRCRDFISIASQIATNLIERKEERAGHRRFGPVFIDVSVP